MVLMVGWGRGGVFKVQGLECVVMVLEPLPYPQLWQNHSPADDGFDGLVRKGGCSFRMYGNGTGTLSLSSGLAKHFPADDGLKGGEKRVCFQGSRFRMYGNGTFPYPQLWQNHSPASDGLMVGRGRGGVILISSRFRIVPLTSACSTCQREKV